MIKKTVATLLTAVSLASIAVLPAEAEANPNYRFPRACWGEISNQVNSSRIPRWGRSIARRQTRSEIIAIHRDGKTYSEVREDVKDQIDQRVDNIWWAGQIADEFMESLIQVNESGVCS